jgi:perosamine synthetase
MINKVIPVNRPKIHSYNNLEIKKALKQKWISGDGPIIEKFENKFKEIIKRKYAIAVSNGTSALEIAIASLNLKEGDHVIVPNLTIVSCLNAILKNGLKPIFVDVNLDDYNISIQDFKKKLSKKIRAVIMVHTYGLASNIKEIFKLKRKYNFKIIEDCAEGIGLKYKKKFLGNFGDLSTFSFYSNKLITTGEGGCILTNNKKYNERCRSLRNLSFGKNIRFRHKEISGNYRMSSLQCAYGISEIPYFNQNIKLKKKIGNFYNLKLRNINFLQLPLKKNKISSNIYWVYPLIIKKNKKINKLHFQKFLKEKKIITRDFFYPLSEQPLLQKFKIRKKKLKNSNFLFENGLYIPSGLGNTFAEFNKVCNAILQYEKKFK